MRVCFFRLRSRKWMKKIEAPAAKSAAGPAAERERLAPRLPSPYNKEKMPRRGLWGEKRSRNGGYMPGNLRRCMGFPGKRCSIMTKSACSTRALSGRKRVPAVCPGPNPPVRLFITLAGRRGAPVGYPEGFAKPPPRSRPWHCCANRKKKCAGKSKPCVGWKNALPLPRTHGNRAKKPCAERPGWKNGHGVLPLVPAGPDVWGDRYRRIAFVRRILKQYGETSPGCFVRSSFITREHLLQGHFEKDSFCLQWKPPITRNPC